MFMLGVLAVLQVCLLPGLLLICIIGIRYAFCTTLILSFFLSVTLNYFIVLGLVAVGGLTQGWVEAIFAVNLVGVTVVGAWRYWSVRVTRPRITVVGGITAVIATMFAVYIIGHVYNSLYSSTYFGSVPHHWDAVVSWNRWALDWASGHVARQSWGYGQLVPAAWAMAYTFLGTTDIELFGKVISDLFPAFFWLPLVDLLLRTRRLEYLVAGVFSFAALHSAIAIWLFSGDVDAPLAAIVLGTVYAILLLDTVAPEDRAKHLAITAIIAGGCALLKQQGMLVIAVMPVLLMGIHGKAVGVTWRRLATMTIAAGAIALSWYAIWAWHLLRGEDISNLLILVADRSLHPESSITGRLVHAGRMWLETTRPDITLSLLVPGLLLAALDRRLRWIAAVLLVPYGLIWAVGFSYDVRNAVMIIPIWCLVAAGGWTALARVLLRAARSVGPWSAVLDDAGNRLKNFAEIRPFPNAAFENRACLAARIALLAAVTAWGVILNARMSDAHLRELQTAAELTKGDPPVTQFLAHLASGGRLHGSVVTNYEPLVYIHSLHGLKVAFRFLRTPGDLKAALAGEAFDYIAVWRGGTETAFFASLLRDGTANLKLVAKDERVIVFASAAATPIRDKSGTR